MHLPSAPSKPYRVADRLGSGFLVLLMAAALGSIALTTASRSTPDAAGYYADRLPTQARDIQALGNGWVRFTLAVDGRERGYLCQLRGDGTAAAIVEVR